MTTPRGSSGLPSHVVYAEGEDPCLWLPSGEVISIRPRRPSCVLNDLLDSSPSSISSPSPGARTTPITGAAGRRPTSTANAVKEYP